MKGRHPQTILTDLDPGLRDVIATELPNTRHVTCIWDIRLKMSSWFALPLGQRYAEFKSEFDALYHLENTDEFELQWNQMVSRYGIMSDRHVGLLFSLRTTWALFYTRGYFLAQMAKPEFSKSKDAFLNSIFDSQTCLRSLFEQVGVSSNFQNRAREEMQYTRIKTCNPIEDHARSILTPFAFKSLQEELVLAMRQATSEMANGSYIVRHFKSMDGERLVLWIPEEEQLHCSCKEFESSGILCSHALRVLIVKNYFQLPEIYFLSRWRKEIPLVDYNDQNALGTNDGWFRELHSLTEFLFTESLCTRERSDYVHRELVRLISEVRTMPASDGVGLDTTLSPTG